MEENRDRERGNYNERLDNLEQQFSKCALKACGGSLRLFQGVPEVKVVFIKLRYLLFNSHSVMNGQWNTFRITQYTNILQVTNE